MSRFTIFITGLFIAISSQVFAHEYYLMPETFSPKAGAELPIRHRLGDKFKGNQLPWITSWNIRSEIWEDGKKREVKRTDGDRPAMLVKLTSSRLVVAVHQSNVDFLKFKTWEKFQKYTDKEGLAHAQAASEAGTKPKLGLNEAYSRYAKTLINVDGSSTGLDIPVGLKIELVALANPLALAANQPMPVQVLYEGKPLVGVSVKVFEGIGKKFAYHTPTDKNGKANIKPAGPGPYLINAIHMTEPQSAVAKKGQAHWESFWASLTFKRKE